MTYQSPIDIINDNPFTNYRITSGQIPGYSVIDKFGENGSVTVASAPADVWEGGSTLIAGSTEYIFTANGGTDYYFSSTDNSDTQNIRFHILTEDSNGNWNIEVFIQQLVGQTKTLLIPPSGDNPIRIYRMENQGTTPLAGMLFTYEDSTVTLGTPDDTNTIRAIINDGNNQTLMTIYTIPTGKVGFLYRGEVGLNFSAGPNATDYAKMSYQSRRFGEVFKIKKFISLITTGNSTYSDIRVFPDPIPAKTDIKIRVEEVSATMGTWGTLDILLVDEDKFIDANNNSPFLDAIGQIQEVD